MALVSFEPMVVSDLLIMIKYSGPLNHRGHQQSYYQARNCKVQECCNTKQLGSSSSYNVPFFVICLLFYFIVTLDGTLISVVFHFSISNSVKKCHQGRDWEHFTLMLANNVQVYLCHRDTAGMAP